MNVSITASINGYELMKKYIKGVGTGFNIVKPIQL